MAARPPSTVVAIDFGTAATGYAIAQLPPAGSPISSARVFPFKPGDRGASATEKNLTAVLLAAGDDLRVIAFGRAARRRFHEMEPEEARGYLFLEQFQMALSRAGRGPLLDRKRYEKLLEPVRIQLMRETTQSKSAENKTK
jgi:hypothetical protein